MALWVGESYVTDNGKTKVIQGALTGEQTAWWWDNGDKPIDEITHLTLDPAQKLYIFLCQNGFKLQEALKSCDLTDKQKLEAQQALNILDNEGNLQNINGDGVVTKLTRPSFVGADLRGRDLEGVDLREADLQRAVLREANLWGAQMQGAILRGTYLRGAKLWFSNLQETDLRGHQMQGADLRGADLSGAKLQGADLRYADLQGAKMQGANLDGADLRLTDLSGVDFNHARNLENTNRNLENTKWKLAFYDATNPPENLPDNIKDKLLALDEPAYKTAKELQDAYREALVSDNEEAITAAEKQLTTYLEQYRRDNATKAIEQAVSVLGAEATFAEVARASAGSAVTITADSATKAASPSGQQGVSLGGADKPANGDVNPYQYYSIGSR